MKRKRGKMRRKYHDQDGIEYAQNGCKDHHFSEIRIDLGGVSWTPTQGGEGEDRKDEKRDEEERKRRERRREMR